MVEARDAAEILNQALPYIQRFQGHTFVVKYGGSAMADRDALRGVIRNVLLFQLVGIRPVLVHGGGPEIDALLKRLDLKTEAIDGLRVTDEATMEAVEMALGKANKSVVGEFHMCGGRAVGLSGRDGMIAVAEPVSERLGRVGRVVRVNPELIVMLCANGYVPVIYSVAHGTDGNAINVNADAAAAAIAVALGAQKLFILSDVDGVLADKDDASSLIGKLTATEAGEMIKSGRASKGMVPKLQSALEAMDDGVGSVHLLNGSKPNSLLIETFTDEGIGTMLVRG